MDETARSLDELWSKQSIYRHENRKDICMPKVRLGFFTEEDMANYVVSNISRYPEYAKNHVTVERYKKYVNVHYNKKFQKQMRIESVRMENLKDDISSYLRVAWQNRQEVRYLDRQGNEILNTTYDSMPMVTDVYVHIPPKGNQQV